MTPARTPSPKFTVVEIPSEGGLVLEGSWYAPRRGKKNVPGVLLVHDAGSERSSFNALAERLQRLGLAVLSVDLRGHGGSKTKKLDWSKLDAEGRASTWAHALKDVDAAVKWLLAQDVVHSTRLCMVGDGAGCALAARHMVSEDNAVAVALLEPPTEVYGFDVKADILDLDGLPTRLVAAGKGSAFKEANSMVDEAKQLSSGVPVIDVLLARPPVLEDTKALSNIAKFLSAVAIPQKGRGKRGR